MKLTLGSWTKKGPLPRQLSERKPMQNVNGLKLPRKPKRRLLTLLLRKQMRKVTSMKTGRKRQLTLRTMLKIAGMLILKRKERRLPLKRPVLQMAKPNRPAYPRELRETRSQNRKNLRKTKRYLRRSKPQP